MVRSDIVGLINEVEKDLEDLLYGSVELHVQDGQVTQVTVRRIKKTGYLIQKNSSNTVKTGEITISKNIANKPVQKQIKRKIGT